MMSSPNMPSYAGYRFPAEVIGYAVYLYFRFPLSRNRPLKTQGRVFCRGG